MEAVDLKILIYFNKYDRIEKKQTEYRATIFSTGSMLIMLSSFAQFEIYPYKCVVCMQ